MAEFMQFLLSGVTVGAVYALVALGFTIIYNASDVVNFAQGEFVMLGGMITVFAYQAGIPLPLAAILAILATAAIGVALNKLAIEPARGAPVVSLIIITIGASIFIRGLTQITFDKQLHRFPSFRRYADCDRRGDHTAAEPMGGCRRAGRLHWAVAVLYQDVDRTAPCWRQQTTAWPHSWSASIPATS